MTLYPRELCSRLAPLAALLAVLVLAGCGVKGGLEPPPGSQPPEPQAAAEPASARPLGAPKASQKSARPDQPFVLDPLL
ncbi:MAG TPA: lipoprotein [Xanthobacteraceae bacterium]